MTANEIQAARTHGVNYWLYLVADCLTDTPRIQAIQNPGAKLSAGEWSAAQTLFAVRFGATSPCCNGQSRTAAYCAYREGLSRDANEIQVGNAKTYSLLNVPSARIAKFPATILPFGGGISTPTFSPALTFVGNHRDHAT